MIPRMRQGYRSSRATLANCSRPWTGFWSYINVSSLPLNTSPRTVRERAPVPPGISNVGPRYTKTTSASWRTATSGSTAAAPPNRRLRSGSAGSSRRELRCQRAESAAGRADARLLSCRDADVSRLSHELASVRSSATWRWTQGLLQSPPVQLLFGGLIRSVARHHLSAESPPAPSRRPGRGIEPAQGCLQMADHGVGEFGGR